MENRIYLFILLFGILALLLICIGYFFIYKHYINKVLHAPDRSHVKLFPPYKVMITLVIVFAVGCVTMIVANYQNEFSDYITDFSPFSINSFSNVNTVLDNALSAEAASDDLSNILSKEDMRAALPFGSFEVNFKDGAFNNLTFTLDLSDSLTPYEKTFQVNYSGQLFVTEKTRTPANVYAGNAIPLYALENVIGIIDNSNSEQFSNIADEQSVTFAYNGIANLTGELEPQNKAYVVSNGQFVLYDAQKHEGQYYTFSIIYKDTIIRLYAPIIINK